MEASLEFEKPIALLEEKLAELRELSRVQGLDLQKEISALEVKLQALVKETYASLTPWQRVQLSRHPNRPYASDLIEAIFPTFRELHGDRCFGDDQALIGGFAEWSHGTTPHPVCVLAQQKGRTTRQRLERNFGMPKPEGYRKAFRLMELAERARTPLICLIDTPGAYPGMDAEERGQSQAIAECIQKAFSLTIPSIAIVLGEGGSGGALAIGIANHVWMMEHSIYSVISPESCASILWSDASLAERASTKLKLTSSDLTQMGIVDGIIQEPFGGAHRHWKASFDAIADRIQTSLVDLRKLESTGPDALRMHRRKKFRELGVNAWQQLPK